MQDQNYAKQDAGETSIPTNPNLCKEEYFQPYLPEEWLNTSTPLGQERCKEFRRERNQNAISRFDLWNFDSYFTYLIRQCLVLVADQKAIVHSISLKEITENSKKILEEISVMNELEPALRGSFVDATISRFFKEILPFLGFKNNYNVVSADRPHGIHPVDYPYLGSHFCHILLTGVDYFTGEPAGIPYDDAEMIRRLLKQLTSYHYPQLVWDLSHFSETEDSVQALIENYQGMWV